MQFWKWLKRKTTKAASPQWRVRDGRTDRPLSETEEFKLFVKVYTENQCPDCGSKTFYGGPRGGMSQNIFCRNVKCRAGFNLTVFDAANGTVERIHRGEIDQYPAEAFGDNLTPEQIAAQKAAIKVLELTASNAPNPDEGWYCLHNYHYGIGCPICDDRVPRENRS